MDVTDRGRAGPTAGRRPVLRPGVRVVARDAGERRVGVEPGRRTVLPGGRATDSLLAALAQADRVPDGLQPLLDRLAGRGLLVDAERRDAARRAAPSYDVAMSALAAHGDDAVARLEARAAARVLVDTGDGAARARLGDLLDRAGLRAAGRAHEAAVGLVLTTDGEPQRHGTDPWMRSGLPHLFLTQRAGRLTVGPFVVPGLTACLRCRDAHEGDDDPDHEAVVEALRPRHDDRPDPLLLDLALAWAVRDLVAFVEGDLPATWSTVVEVDPGLRLGRRELRRHPRCGCSWGDGLATA